MALGLLEKIQSWRFHYGLDLMVQAYRASRSEPQSDKARVMRAWQAIDASPGSVVNEADEDEYRNHLSALDTEANEILKLIQESFVISLFHYWERQSKSWTGKMVYRHDDMMADLAARGMSPERASLDTLRLVANVAKHSAGDSAEKLFAKRPDLFRHSVVAEETQIPRRDDEPEPAYVPGYEDLRVSHELLEQFFADVRHSGPQRTRISF
ncbi:MAG: hypothetical protein AB1942_18440 [Pseudomonadota bacterium]